MSESAIAIFLHGAAGRMGLAVRAMAKTEGVPIHGAIELRDGISANHFGDEMRLVEIPSRVRQGDVVIDFSRAGAVGPLIGALAGTGLPIVCGTTGIDHSERELLDAYSKESPVFYDENMSYGISLLKKLLRSAAPLLRAGSDVEIVEFHHRDKADFPSGTALALARTLDPDAETVVGRGGFAHPDPQRLHIHPVRIGGVAGEHHIHVGMAGETLTFSHRATSRDVFARGALLAARFVVGRDNGFFTMDDLLEESGHV